jgi:hypothetical protein
VPSSEDLAGQFVSWEETAKKTAAAENNEVGKNKRKTFFG